MRDTANSKLKISASLVERIIIVNAFFYKKLIFLISFFFLFELKTSFIFNVLIVLAIILYGYQILMIIICMLMLISTSNWM